MEVGVPNLVEALFRHRVGSSGIIHSLVGPG